MEIAPWGVPFWGFKGSLKRFVYEEIWAKTGRETILLHDGCTWHYDELLNSSVMTVCSVSLTETWDSSVENPPITPPVCHFKNIYLVCFLLHLLSATFRDGTNTAVQTACSNPKPCRKVKRFIVTLQLEGILGTSWNYFASPKYCITSHKNTLSYI